mgnify:CR=1 FL=1
MSLRENIRNFSIIAHIDHGKSTLADRLLEKTGTIDSKHMRDQVMDRLELEREKGITIKAKAIRMIFPYKGTEYILNLIDTPGHVDFTYEVSRGLAACEGALLVVDASQGVEAQTLANLHLAQEAGLKLVPVVNKIDLPNSDIEKTKRQIQEIFPIPVEKILTTSAKLGTNIDTVFQAIIERIPSPEGDPTAPLSALLFDAIFDAYRGVIIYLRLRDGRIRQGMEIRMMSTGKIFKTEEVGIFKYEMTQVSELKAGEVGYLIAGIKDIHAVKIGETITEANRPTERPFAGFRETKPYVFSGLFPVSTGDYEALKKALEKLWLNDASFEYKPFDSPALGYGYHCGFLGKLHMDIIRERLEKEYGIEIIATAPNVSYDIVLKNGEVKTVASPDEFPENAAIKEIFEPYILLTIILPSHQVGAAMQLSELRRGKFKNMMYIDPQRTVLTYELPWAEMVLDFYDRLKSETRGYATLDYQHIGKKRADLVKLTILVNNQAIDVFSAILPRDQAYYHARRLVDRLSRAIPRQLFALPIQAKVEGRIVARKTVPALRKDVIAKCYGGDVTRKRKLLEKQKEGKKRMKRIGQVDIPPEVFISFLNME